MRTRPSQLQGAMSQTEEQKRWEPKVVNNIYTFVQLATLINSTDGNYTSRELLCLLYPNHIASCTPGWTLPHNIHLSDKILQKRVLMKSFISIVLLQHLEDVSRVAGVTSMASSSICRGANTFNESFNWQAFRLKEDWLPKSFLVYESPRTQFITNKSRFKAAHQLGTPTCKGRRILSQPGHL